MEIELCSDGVVGCGCDFVCDEEEEEWGELRGEMRKDKV